MLPAQRQQHILEILKKEFTVRSTRLSHLLEVSEMTIRRDLDLLEHKGLVERTHGGAIFRQERIVGKFRYQSSIKANPKEKQQIALKAASLIEPHDVIYIGEGTTSAQVIRYADPKMPFSIFTNNLGVIAEVNDMAADLILLGGGYNRSTYSLSGAMTIEAIRQINATKVFLGADGLSLNTGMTTPNLEIAVINRTMIQHTHGQVIVMANHTKFGLVAKVMTIPFKNIDILITNRKVPRDFQRDLEKSGVNVIIA